MGQYLGFRGVAVLENVTKGDFGRNVPMAIEVTATTETKIYINEFPEQGHLPQGIPVPVGTRLIPMQTYNFRSDDPVTVVGYRP